MAAGLFDGLDDDIRNEIETKSEIVLDGDLKTNRQKVIKNTKRGRPRTSHDRVSFTIKPLAATKSRLQEYATNHGRTSSEVIDALVSQFLNKLEL